LAEDVRHLEAVMPFIGNLYLEDIHDGTLRPFVDARYKDGVKPRTINAVLQVVRHIMNLSAASWRDDQGMSWLLQAPKITLEPLEDTEAKPYPLSWSEERQLFSELPLDLAEACLFSVNTGLRDQDVCSLRWEWEHRVVGYDVSVFIIPSSYIKNGEDRLVVLNDVASSVVNSRRENGSDWVFPSPKTGKQRYRLHSTAWKNAWKRSGLPSSKEYIRGVHNLKHTFGRRLRAAGVNHEDRQVLLGHTNGSITTHYSGPEILSLLESANKVCRERPEAVLRKAGNVGGIPHKTPTSGNKKRGRIAATP
jgi:integrase